MNANYIISELSSNKDSFSILLKNLPNDIISWKQDQEKWSLLEIVCHLYDEEREDFRARMKSILADPNKELAKIDPQGWVLTRNYSEQDIYTKIEHFIVERNKSIEYLKQLDQPKWDNFYQHPKFGNQSVKMFFTNWLAHDYLHMKQIIKLKFDYLSYISKENLNYAGEWN